MTPPIPSDWHPETMAVRAALPRSQYGEHSEALYLTSSFVLPDSQTAADYFADPQQGMMKVRPT